MHALLHTLLDGGPQAQEVSRHLLRVSEGVSPLQLRHRPRLSDQTSVSGSWEQHGDRQGQRCRREREKLGAEEATAPLLDPRAELDAVLDEVDSIVNPLDGHAATDGVAADDSDDKIVVPVPFHPTMRHDEYVKGVPPMSDAACQRHEHVDKLYSTSYAVCTGIMHKLPAMLRITAYCEPSSV